MRGGIALFAVVCLLVATPVVAGTVYRCDSPDGVRSYVSKRVPGAKCSAISSYTASRSSGVAKISAPSKPSLPGAAVGSATPAHSTEGSPAAVDSGSSITLTNAAPVSAVKSGATGSRRVQGQVYSYIKDGVRHYTSERPKGVARASAVSFPDTPLPRAVLTGNPVRGEIAAIDLAEQFLRIAGQGSAEVREAFEPAARRLALTGTPFRSDTAAIPFVEYAEDAAGRQQAASEAVERISRDEGLPLRFAEINLVELRSVLARVAQVAREPGPRVVIARHLADATDAGGNGDGVLQFSELKINSDLIVLSTPEIAGLPYVISGLIAAGGLAARGAGRPARRHARGPAPDELSEGCALDAGAACRRCRRRLRRRTAKNRTPASSCAAKE